MQSVPISNLNSKLLFVILLCVVLYFGKPLLVPVAFSILLAMLMTPLANKMEERGISRIYSSIVSILIVVLVLSAIASLIIFQIVNLSEDFPSIQKKLESYLDQLKTFFETTFNLSSHQIMEFLKKQGSSFGKSLNTFLSGVTNTFGSIVLMLVFMFLFLLKRDKYEAFFLKIYGKNNPDQAKEIMHKISKVAQHYLLGRAYSIIILTILYFIGISIVGVKNAFLLSAIAALATIIPYIGTLVGSLFPFIMAILTGSMASALGVLGVIFFIQTVDNYFIEPYVVGGEVNVNAFFSIVSLLAGGLIWGVAGIILFLPLTGIIKIICDNVSPLQPYGYLIGDEKSENKVSKMIKGLFKKKK